METDVSWTTTERAVAANIKSHRSECEIVRRGIFFNLTF